MATPFVQSTSPLLSKSLNLEGSEYDAQSQTVITIAESFMRDFSVAMEKCHIDRIVGLIHPDGWWRDMLALSWEHRTVHGTDEIHKFLVLYLAKIRISCIRLEDGKIPVLSNIEGAFAWIEMFFNFETEVAVGRGVIRLRQDRNTWKAFTIYTCASELKGFEEKVGPTRSSGTIHGEILGRKGWSEKRREEIEKGEHEVLIIGAGQAGLCTAASLGMLGVDALIIEKNDRIGDNWRKRYEFLVLHDPVYYNHFPYLPYPKHWPVFTPKDRLADWFECYAAALELNVWTHTTLVTINFDQERKRWIVKVIRKDGTKRTITPAHIVMATGLDANPNIPSFKGIESFEGNVHHASAHNSGKNWAGKKVVVVGCCNSGMDISHFLYEQGVEVTMVQRSSTYVMSSMHGIKILFQGLYEEGGPPTEDADLVFASIPIPVMAKLHQIKTKEIAELDKEILHNLEKVGFKYDMGIDGSGFFMKYLSRGGGYYIDVGCCKLIGDGKIKIKQGVEIDSFDKDGIIFCDGSKLEADIVVLATGYRKDVRETVRKLFGNKVADCCKEVWGLNEEGELRGAWQRSGHPGLWIVGGNLHFSRFCSRNLALQIKAIQEGLLDY
ncbi:putative indole-3-pyruvate monooxygenase [Neolecta irregularis DAH-3]|uniref:Putative indole-3-pyruvate monooxygenase n=1 Tax=Neolecta irregularis (strain DAH-3) TaxID=1198029 RepID=A0A1U7LVR2_NEOID|nr:putative indole-3-pyruvate monooxygenase [Neolecta irregularis DAH-3]|eukprot:OLL26601.1 putative indole-3-pyruvate monooxygenase [Neolecta irregularis DAH-3]